MELSPTEYILLRSLITTMDAHRKRSEGVQMSVIFHKYPRTPGDTLHDFVQMRKEGCV